jgi:hypothetical protein
MKRMADDQEGNTDDSVQGIESSGGFGADLGVAVFREDLKNGSRFPGRERVEILRKAGANRVMRILSKQPEDCEPLGRRHTWATSDGSEEQLDFSAL